MLRAAERQICFDDEYAYANIQCNLIEAASTSACIKRLVRREGSPDGGNGARFARKDSISTLTDRAAAS